MGNKDVECAYINVSVIGKSSSYEQNGSAYNYQYKLIVRKEDTEKAIEIVVLTLQKYGIHCLRSAIRQIPTPCSIAYVAGMDWVTKDSIWSEDRIIEETVKFAKNILTNAQNNKEDNSIKSYDNQLNYPAYRK